MKADMITNHQNQADEVSAEQNSAYAWAASMKSQIIRLSQAVNVLIIQNKALRTQNTILKRHLDSKLLREDLLTASLVLIFISEKAVTAVWTWTININYLLSESAEKPDKFKRAFKNLNFFFFKCWLWFKIQVKCYSTENQQIMAVIDLLEDKIFDWIEQFLHLKCTDKMLIELNNLEMLKKTLQWGCDIIDEAHEAEREIDTLHQKHSVIIHQWEFMMRTQYLSLNNIILHMLFYQDLKKDIKNELTKVSQENLNTLNRVMNCSVTIDNRMFEQQQERQRQKAEKLFWNTMRNIFYQLKKTVNNREDTIKIDAFQQRNWGNWSHSQQSKSKKQEHHQINCLCYDCEKSDHHHHKCPDNLKINVVIIVLDSESDESSSELSENERVHF